MTFFVSWVICFIVLACPTSAFYQIKPLSADTQYSVVELVDSAPVLASGTSRVVDLPKLTSSAFSIDQVEPFFADTVLSIEDSVELASVSASLDAWLVHLVPRASATLPIDQVEPV